MGLHCGPIQRHRQSVLSSVMPKTTPTATTGRGQPESAPRVLTRSIAVQRLSTTTDHTLTFVERICTKTAPGTTSTSPIGSQTASVLTATTGRSKRGRRSSSRRMRASMSAVAARSPGSETLRKPSLSHRPRMSTGPAASTWRRR